MPAYCRISFCAMISSALVSPAAAQAKDEETLDTITVHGRAFELIGAAGAASEGVVGYADFKDRPLSRIGELVEVIPGIVAAQRQARARPTSIFCEASILTMAPISPPASTAYRLTCGPMGTARAISTSIL